MRPDPPAGETGCLPVIPNGARQCCQLVNARQGSASTALTSKKGFEQWREFLQDRVRAAPLPDRLPHRCQIVNIRGNGCRIRHQTRLSKTVHPTASRAAEAEYTRQREGS